MIQFFQSVGMGLIENNPFFLPRKPPADQVRNAKMQIFGEG